MTNLDPDGWMKSFLIVAAAAFVFGTMFVYAATRDQEPRVSRYWDAPPFQRNTPILPGQCGQNRGYNDWHQFQCPDVGELRQWRP